MIEQDFLNKIDADWQPAWKRLIDAFGFHVVLAAKESAEKWSRECPVMYRTLEYESRERAKAFDEIILKFFPDSNFSYLSFGKDWKAG